MHEIDVLTQHATKTEGRNELRMGWEGGGVIEGLRIEMSQEWRGRGENMS